MKKIGKILISVGVVYWCLLIIAGLTGCKITKDCSSCSNCDTCYINPLETTISLDPRDRSQWHEREEFLRHFE